MSTVDVVILGVIGLSAVLGFWRGIISSVVSLLTWSGAIFITLLFSNRFAAVLPIDAVESPLARATISALVLFFGTLFIGILISRVVGKIFPRSSLGIYNRGLGVVFGLVRGVVLVVLLVLAGNLAPELKQETWWSKSRLLPNIQKVAQRLHKRLPESIGQHFDFNKP